MHNGRILTCVSLDSNRPRMLLWRMNKAAADPVEETDAVLGAKLCGSMTTLSVGTSYLASAHFIVFFRFLIRTQHQITQKSSSRMKSPPAPAKRPTSSLLKTGWEPEDTTIGSVKVCEIERVVDGSGPAKDYKIHAAINKRTELSFSFNQEFRPAHP